MLIGLVQDLQGRSRRLYRKDEAGRSETVFRCRHDRRDRKEGVCTRREGEIDGIQYDFGGWQ